MDLVGKKPSYRTLTKDLDFQNVSKLNRGQKSKEIEETRKLRLKLRRLNMTKPSKLLKGNLELESFL